MSFNGGFAPGGNQNTGFSFGQLSAPATSTVTSSSGLFSNGGTGGQPPTSTQQQSSGFSFGMKPPGSGGLFGSQTSSATVGQSQPSAFSGGTSAFSGGTTALGATAFSGGTSAFSGGTPSSFGFGGGGVQTTSSSAAPTTGYFLGAGATAAPTSLPQQKPPVFSFSTAGGFGGQTASGGASGFPFSQTPGSANSTPAFNTGGSEPLTGGSKPFPSIASAPGLGSGGGFNFSKPSDQAAFTTTATSTGTGLFKPGAGIAAQATQPSTMGFNFGTATSSSGGGFSLATSTAPTQQSTGSFTPSSTSFTAPETTAPTATASGFGFGNKLGATTVTTAPTSTAAPVAGGLSLGGKTSSTLSGFSGLGSTAASTPPSSITSGFKPTSSSATSGFKLGGVGGTSLFNTSTSAPAASTSSGPLKSVPSGTLTKGFTLGGTSTATTATTAAVTAATSATTTMTATMKYSDLEAKVNSWMSELEQQETLFLTQATHVNAWNRLLIENADKITNLNTEFENVELSQKRLNAELDYIKTQQNELEELLKPLEEKTKQQMAVLSSSVHTHHADIERERTYNLAENIDSQLKNMAQDLREVVEHINSTTTPADASNPVFQIGKILSAHMDSLQWLDSNSASLQLKVQGMTKQADQMKREHETKFRLAFN